MGNRAHMRVHMHSHVGMEQSEREKVTHARTNTRTERERERERLIHAYTRPENHLGPPREPGRSLHRNHELFHLLLTHIHVCWFPPLIAGQNATIEKDQHTCICVRVRMQHVLTCLLVLLSTFNI